MARCRKREDRGLVWDVPFRSLGWTGLPTERCRRCIGLREGPLVAKIDFGSVWERIAPRRRGALGLNRDGYIGR
jgi:hypothetical protein